MQVEIRNGGVPLTFEADLGDGASLLVSQACEAALAGGVEDMDAFAPIVARVFGGQADAVIEACGGVEGVAVLCSRLMFESKVRRMPIVEDAVRRYSVGIA